MILHTNIIDTHFDICSLLQAPDTGTGTLLELMHGVSDQPGGGSNPHFYFGHLALKLNVVAAQMYDSSY